uniref:(northern house mosquito) hypothetical protein n=1 Tax=Culex pipiens TaxID=7175 RepID=A0A8D8AL57_CULPI
MGRIWPSAGCCGWGSGSWTRGGCCSCSSRSSECCEAGSWAGVVRYESVSSSLSSDSDISPISCFSCSVNFWAAISWMSLSSSADRPTFWRAISSGTSRTCTSGCSWPLRISWGGRKGRIASGMGMRWNWMRTSARGGCICWGKVSCCCCWCC